MIRASNPLPRVSQWANRFVGDDAEPEVELIVRARRLSDREPEPETFDFQPTASRGGVPVYELAKPPIGLLIPLIAFGLLGFAAPGFWIAAACFGIALGARYASNSRSYR